MGNKIVLKGYSVQPVVTETDSTIEIAQGEPCGEGDGTDRAPSAATRMATAFGFPMFVTMMGTTTSPKMGAVAATAVTAAWMAPSAWAQTTAECSSVPIEVEIYVDATVEEVVNKMYNAGEFDPCPAESKSRVAGHSRSRSSCLFLLFITTISFLITPLFLSSPI